MIPADLLAAVRRIDILTNRIVSETFAGEYLSVFKGRGMEFSQVREYTPGDDVRAIDWNVTARLSRPFVRQYVEERELTVIIACDLSGSLRFGSAGRLKQEIAAELCGVLAAAALHNNDKVGLFLFTDRIEEYLPPKKGRRHVLHLIRDVLAFSPESRGTRVGQSLSTISRMLKRRSILFLISDFRDEGFERPLKMAAVKHDVIPVVLSDPREKKWPAVDAYVELEDPEGDGRVMVRPGAPGPLASYFQREESRLSGLGRLFRLYGLDPIFVSTHHPYIGPLIQFFRLRAKRMRH